MSSTRAVADYVEWDGENLSSKKVIIVRVSEDIGLALLKGRNVWKLLFGISKASSPARSAYLVTPTEADLFWDWSGIATWLHSVEPLPIEFGSFEGFDVL